MSDQNPTLDGVLTLYERANVSLRIAILIIVCWPLCALAAATLLHGSAAQTIVPIVDLSPLLAILLAIIDAPSGIIVLLKNPIARKGIRFFSAMIGIELAIGAFLSVVPISNDRGLVPLLLLTSFALFFLWVARFARPLQFVLAIGLIILTVIFIQRGRPSSAPLPGRQLHAATRTSSPSTPPYYSSTLVRITLTAQWQHVRLPWNTFAVNVHANNGQPSSFFFLCDNRSQVSTFTGHGEGAMDNCYDPRTSPFLPSFAVHGNGIATFTPTSPEIPSPEPPVAAAPPDVQTPVSSPATQIVPPLSPVPDWSQAHEGDFDHFSTMGVPCIQFPGRLVCYFRIKGTDVEIPHAEIVLNYGGETPTRAIDDQGNEYIPVRASLGIANTSRRNDTTIPDGIWMLGSLTFTNFAGEQIPRIDLMIGYGINQTLRIAFHHVSITRASQ